MENTETDAPMATMHETFLRQTSRVAAPGIPAGYEIRRAVTKLATLTNVRGQDIEVLYLVKSATAGAPEWLTYRASIANDRLDASMEQGKSELEAAARYHLVHGILPGDMRFHPVTDKMLRP